MLIATFEKYELQFIRPVLTSRGAMAVKNGYFVTVTSGQTSGVGECSFIEGLSRDDLSMIEHELDRVCSNIQQWESIKEEVYQQFPSIVFAIETALLDFKNGGTKQLFATNFSAGSKAISINGLVWMGSKSFMLEQLQNKLAQGFKCIKIKVGAIDFEEECDLIGFIRSHFDAAQMEIRLDANGAFKANDVFAKMERLSRFQIHSIEQPIAVNQWDLMKEICNAKIIDVALDEELIYTVDTATKQNMLDCIAPQYIILKPSLIGGFDKSNEWIQFAEERNMQWWATSALESNIGLNAIAQWVSAKQDILVQGLGTGALYTNNIDSPLVVRGGQLWYDTSLTWKTENDVTA
jgi:O-succinylbenzoate synthase